ncbi:MAG: hypothetical protein MJZ61_09345 [Bacteroidales bacterium]|nr:hypothetical protein [Bacteroidales bacterium]
MNRLNWTGVISEGILKLKLAFSHDVSIPERMAIMSKYADSFSKKGVSIIESQHFEDASSIKAILNK